MTKVQGSTEKKFIRSQKQPSFLSSQQKMDIGETLRKLPGVLSQQRQKKNVHN